MIRIFLFWFAFFLLCAVLVGLFALPIVLACLFSPWWIMLWTITIPSDLCILIAFDMLVH